MLTLKSRISKRNMTTPRLELVIGHMADKNYGQKLGQCSEEMAHCFSDSMDGQYGDALTGS